MDKVNERNQLAEDLQGIQNQINEKKFLIERLMMELQKEKENCDRVKKEIEEARKILDGLKADK